jgi:L-asparaginase / beta-aspartyl-peptidase
LLRLLRAGWTNVQSLAILKSVKPSLIVHGGAWDIPDEAVEACNDGCRRALAAGWKVLASGGSAVEAVEAAVIVLEDDPVFDAGYGSHLNADGRVECDAIVMDGSTLRAGAAAGLQRLKNPIRLARKILETSPHMMLIADGAERFAKDSGLALCRPEELVSEAEWEAYLRCSKDEHAAEYHRGHEQGTVGAVALDSDGRLFAATSTGGTCCKHPGRVGDSPLIGCGCYADSQAGGVSCTGYGEAIMKIVMSKSAVDFLRRDSLDGGNEVAAARRAAQDAVRLLAERGKGTGGLILLDRSGTPAFAFNTPRMAYGYVNSDGTFVVAV